MKELFIIVAIALMAFILLNERKSGIKDNEIIVRDTIVIHDTIPLEY